MEEIVVSKLNDPLKCNLCGSLNTRHVSHMVDGAIEEAWWRCLGCKKDYGSKLLFFQNSNTGEVTIKTEILWKKEIKEEK